MFKDMKLGTKILFGFMIIVVLLGVVAYVGYSGLADVVESVDKADDANRIVKDTLEIRREEKNFIIREDKKYVRMVEDMVEKTKKHIEDMKTKIKDPKILAELDEGIADVKSYEKTFAHYVDAHDKKIVEQRIMEKIAREVMASTGEIKDQQERKLEVLLDSGASGAELKERVHKVEAANHLLQIEEEIRREEKNYMMRHDKKYIEMVHKELEVGINLINEYRPKFEDSKTLSLLDKTMRNLNEYQTAFDEYVSLTDKQYAADEEMVLSARSLLDLAERLRVDEKAMMLEHEANANRLMIIISLTGIVLGLFLAFFVGRAIAGPIVSVAEIIHKAATERDLTLEIPVAGKDEVGVMAGEMNGFLRLLKDAFLVADEAAENVEENAGNVAQRASRNRDRAENEQKQVQEIQKTVSEMGATAGEVAGHSTAQKEAADESSKHIEGLVNTMNSVAEASDAQTKEANVATERVGMMGETGGKVVAISQKQGEQVEQVTEAVNKMAKAVEEMTNAASEAAKLGQESLKAAEEGTGAVNATVEGMRAISESSEQISEIITVITEIAEQTNLLSLNAAIEAARAGEHGKGFAVVADEVGKLAQRSSEAAKEITQLIKDSTASVDEGTKLTDQSQIALKKIAEGGDANMKAINEIAGASNRLAEGTQEVNSMMEALNTLAMEIGGMAGQQGERREAAQKALAALVEESSNIATLVSEANQTSQSVSGEMEGIVKRTQQMEELTQLQAGRSKKLNEITEESMEGARATVEGAGQVVGITDELQKLSHSLTEQVEQFKVKAEGARKAV